MFEITYQDGELLKNWVAQKKVMRMRSMILPLKTDLSYTTVIFLKKRSTLQLIKLPDTAPKSFAGNRRICICRLNTVP